MVKPESLMYWTRVGLGALLGFLHAFFWRPPSSIISSFLNMLLVYLSTYYLFKKVYRERLKDDAATWKEGVGSFFLAWLFTWFLLYNILFQPG
ncbi:MAG: hypothetical protein QW797_05515 [Thermoproteota archaeon]